MSLEREARLGLSLELDIRLATALRLGPLPRLSVSERSWIRRLGPCPRLGQVERRRLGGLDS